MYKTLFIFSGIECTNKRHQPHRAGVIVFFTKVLKSWVIEYRWATLFCFYIYSMNALFILPADRPFCVFFLSVPFIHFVRNFYLRINFFLNFKPNILYFIFVVETITKMEAFIMNALFRAITFCFLLERRKKLQSIKCNSKLFRHLSFEFVYSCFALKSCLNIIFYRNTQK